MMKKTIIIIIAVILVILSARKLNAASEYSEDVYEESEFLEVKELAEEFSEQFSNFPEGEINFGYKLYALDPGVFTNLITSGIPFMQLTMSEWIGCDRPYAWILPIGEINYCDLQHINNEWVIGFTLNNYENITAGLPKGCEWAPGIVNFDVVQDILEQTEARGEKLTGEQLVFTVAETDTTFFAFRTDAETYLIAFPWRPDLTGLKSGACYTAQKAKDILDKTYPVIYADDGKKGEALSGGGAASAYKHSDFENVTEWLLKEEAQKEEKNKATQSANTESETEEEPDNFQKPGEDGWVEYECDGICFSVPEDWKTGCVPGTARIRISEQSRSEISIKVYHEDQRILYERLGYLLYDDPDEEAEAFYKANAGMPESMEKFEYDLNGLHFHAYCVNNLTYYDRTEGSDKDPKNLSLLYLVFSDKEIFGNIEVWLLEEDLNNYGPELLRMLFSFHN